MPLLKAERMNVMVASSGNGPKSHQHFSDEYEQINENFRFLAEVRFKLLALIPPLGGVAVFVLAHLGFTAGGSEGSLSALLFVSLASIFGLLVTLGITIYDQRNSELYNALIHRAKNLEELFQVPSAPGGLNQDTSGGQFRERPGKNRRVIGLTVGHDIGLALIYGPVLGAWLFPISYSISRLLSVAPDNAAIIGVSAAGLASLWFAANLIYLDNKDKKLYDKAAKRDARKNDAKGQTSGG